MSAFALPIPPAGLTTRLLRPTERSSTTAPLSRCRGAGAVRSFGQPLRAPLHLPRGPTRPVSYYAFFQGWLLLSQPPGCLGLPTSFATERLVGDLSWRSGLLPSRRRTLAPAVCLPDCYLPVFGVCIGLVSRDGPLAETVLYPRQ